MSRRARQKRYTPRRIDPMGGLSVFRAREPMPDEDVRDILIHARVAFDQLLRGKATAEELLALGFASNATLLFAEAGFGRECVASIRRAQEALLRAHDRMRSSGRIGLDGPGITALREMLDVYEQQLEAATVGDMRAVLAEIARRIDAGEIAQAAGELDGIADAH